MMALFDASMFSTLSGAFEPSIEKLKAKIHFRCLFQNSTSYDSTFVFSEPLRRDAFSSEVTCLYGSFCPHQCHLFHDSVFLIEMKYPLMPVEVQKTVFLSLT